MPVNRRTTSEMNFEVSITIQEMILFDIIFTKSCWIIIIALRSNIVYGIIHFIDKQLIGI